MRLIRYRCMHCGRFFEVGMPGRHKCPSCVNTQFPQEGNMDLVRWEFMLNETLPNPYEASELSKAKAFARRVIQRNKRLGDLLAALGD